MTPAIDITMSGPVHGEAASELHAYAERRLTMALRRFHGHIRRVRLRLIDVNGPKKGVDTRCALTAELATGGQLFVEATTAWPFHSVTKAAARMAGVLRREVGARHRRVRTAAPPFTL